jgi:hypothetical protein
MKLPGLKSRVSFGLPGFAGLPTLRSGRHSSPGLKTWGFLAGFIKYPEENGGSVSAITPMVLGMLGRALYDSHTLNLDAVLS